MSGLKGRAAVVTGAGRGIGAACARALAARGATVVVAARSADQVEAVAASIRDAGGSAHAATVDVTRPESVDALAALATERTGGVQILVNNAGVAGSAPLHRLDPDEWDRIMAVNATGTFLCARAFLPGMLASGWGRIVNVASVAGLTGAPYITAYAASKHAVVGFTRALAAEVAAKGVTVNAVCPGYVDTEMTRASVERIVDRTGMDPDRAREALSGTSPQKRLIDPEEVAWLVRVLCEDGARGINGQAVAQDGGGLLA